MSLLKCSTLVLTKCRYLTRSPVNFSTRHQSLLHVTPEENNFLKRKINELVTWYEELTGMDEVREMQNRVIAAQERFAVAQEKRRDANKELNAIQLKLKEISSELDTTSRGEARYLQLVTQEHQILKEERRINTEFALLEREERESFALLSSYVKESHQKERAQAERTKYWSIIGSMIGTILGVVGSSINNEFKMRELRKLVKETNLKTSTLAFVSNESWAAYEKELNSLLTTLKGVVNYSDQNGNNWLTNLSSQGNSTNNTARLEEKVEELKQMLRTTQNYDGHLVALPVDFEELINNHKYEMKIVLISAAAISIVTPIIISLFR